MKTNSNYRPETFFDLKNGSWHYNYNVVEGERTDENNVIFPTYDYDTVEFKEPVVYENIVKSMIRNFIDSDKEFDLINSYNAYLLGINTDVNCETEYIAYIQKVKEIKAQVKNDLNNYKAIKELSNGNN